MFSILQPGDQHEHPARALGRAEPPARRARQELIRHREAATTGQPKRSSSIFNIHFFCLLKIM